MNSSISILQTLDPFDREMDELHPIDSIVQGTQVVGIGEGAHFVNEFGLVRARLARYLIERHKFTHISLEMGLLQAMRLNPWVQGQGEENDLHFLAGPLTVGIYGNFLTWLRRYNLDCSQPVEIIGADLPNTLTLSDDLVHLTSYIKNVDNPILGLLIQAQEIAQQIKGTSAVISANSWLSLDLSEQNLLASLLSRISQRAQMLKHSYIEVAGDQAFENAWMHLKSALHTLYMLEAMSDLFSGKAMQADTSVRDYFAATTLMQIISNQPAMRVVVVAHNNHIQKNFVVFEDGFGAYPMGSYLAETIGNSYRAIGLTHTSNTVPEMDFPAPESPIGFNVKMTKMEETSEHSFEKTLDSLGFSDNITLTNLLQKDSRLEHITCMRSQSSHVKFSLQDSFDAILSIPCVSQDPNVS